MDYSRPYHLGWVVSNEEFMNKAGFINYLKLRGSAGINGNDFDSFTSPAYFAYINRFMQSGSYPLGIDLSIVLPDSEKQLKPTH